MTLKSVGALSKLLSDCAQIDQIQRYSAKHLTQTSQRKTRATRTSKTFPMVRGTAKAYALLPLTELSRCFEGGLEGDLLV